jgi:large subunit ribosomal protein L4
MKVDVLNISGDKSGRSVDLPDNIFGIEPHQHSLYLAVKAYNAHQRQGTHKAKERGEIAGSTRKIKRQKGTGTARAGSIKNPLFRGGGRAFGPRPRKYTVSLNKKVKRLARASALSYKAANGQLLVVEDFTFDAPRTKEMENVLSNFKLTDKKSVLVIGDIDKNVFLSTKNIAKASCKQAKEICTYDIMNGGTILMSESAVEKIKETFKA